MIVGFVLAVRLAWVVAQRWLEQFAYRIELGAGVFLLAGLTAILIALMTVSFQSVKAALMNPADSLKEE